MSDFTQGPFSVAETRHKYDIVIRGPKNEPIALVLIAGFSKKEGAANATLLAAAPDLLEALQWYEAKAVQMGRAAIDQDSKLLLELMKEIAVEYGARARAAIAKATGEQQCN